MIMMFMTEHSIISTFKWIEKAMVMQKYANLHKAEIDIKENGIKSLQVIEEFL
jgi:hypothetical protein